ncbi:hypothetical protein L21SP5_03122 [Salinivirga cyanobacteriivorans]|uniref:Uncharacterized protein n=1 Tax=Salinivirga cyanobacteriivorans TaxID=1307839 RepID=A0A0S2I338_9BACT|nr:hypothetical protein [Salinivirga cyanobacteriivorans]ALO16737.1 hypothetical protein L21SP5_03122 [Salinivirga cyanobacteriivorans]
MKELSTKEIQQMISDIAEGFASIDHKVMELTEVSNDDFTALNNIMKNHHETTYEIAQSTTQIIENIQNLKHNDALLHLRSTTDNIKLALKECATNIKNYMDQVNILNLDFKHLYIPILNFKQNISTLKFLITNLKLNQGLVAQKNQTNTNELIDKLNKKIEEIQAEIPRVAKDVELLKNQFQKAYDKANTINLHFSKAYLQEPEAIDQVITFIEKGIEKTANIKRTLEQKNQHSFQNLNQVITNLQYHDIIRQKIEHIQDTHKNIITELNNLEKEKNIIKKGLEYVNQIPGITEIQAAQLLLTNKEYQSAIENISKKLIETANTLEEVNNLSYSIFNNDNNIEITTQLEENAKNLPGKMKEATTAIMGLVEENEELQKQISNHVNHYENLEAIEHDINAIIKEINKNLSPQNDIKTITGKLITLLNDINDSRSNIGKIINAHQNNQLISLIENINEQKSVIEKQKIEKQKSSEFTEAFKALNNQITKNCKAYKELDSELQNTLENIKYYDFYEHEVEEIINQLNLIYQKIKPLSGDNQHESDLMSAMEKAYTMESQREIHQHKTEDEQQDEKEDDDNLELF